MTQRPKSDFLDVMVARGYLQDCTDLAGLDARLDGRRRARPTSATTPPRSRCTSGTSSTS